MTRSHERAYKGEAADWGYEAESYEARVEPEPDSWCVVALKSSAGQNQISCLTSGQAIRSTSGDEARVRRTRPHVLWLSCGTGDSTEIHEKDGLKKPRKTDWIVHAGTLFGCAQLNWGAPAGGRDNWQHGDRKSFHGPSNVWRRG